MAKKLTDEQLQDARRLRSIFDERKATDRSMTQESLAAECGWKTQSAVQQYLNGVVPLNLSAALKFSRALRVRIDEISPTLAGEIYSANLFQDKSGVGLSDQALLVARAFEKLQNDAQRRAVLAQLSAFGVLE